MEGVRVSDVAKAPGPPVALSTSSVYPERTPDAFEMAARLYESLLELDAADREAWEPLLDVYRRLGRTQALADLLAKVVSSVDDPVLRARLRLERVKVMMEHLGLGDDDKGLDALRRAWKGEQVNGGVLSPWPGCEGGPPVLLGAWRNPRWIAYAAKQCSGWVASCLYSTWEDLQAGMRLYREAGGTNAVLANVVVDLSGRAEAGSLAERAQVSLVCLPDDARQRLKRLEHIGFDEILVVSPAGALDDLERVRDFL